MVNPLYQQINWTMMELNKDNYKKMIETSYSQRPNFFMDDKQVNYSQIFAIIRGTHFHEEDYLNELFEFVHEKKNLQLIGKDFLNKQIDNGHFQSIQKILNIHQEQNLSVNRLVAFLDGEKLLPRSNQPVIHRLIRQSFIDILKLFEQATPNGLKSPELRRILVDLIKWSANHLIFLENITSINDFSKFLWYGEASTSHQYFLVFLKKLGLDCLIYDCTKKQKYVGLNDVQKIELENEKDLEFPNERVQRVTTVAYRAAREIDTMMQTEENVFFRPWALREHQVKSITMKTTYDELFIMSKAQSFIRPNFKVQNNIVSIPVVFGKIMGVSRNRKEYWDRFHTMVEQENTLLLKEFPILNETSADFRLHYQNACVNRKLDKEKLMKGNYWANFARLPYGVQQTIAEGLIQTVESSSLFSRFGNENDEDLKIYIFKQITRLPMEIVRMIQKYDFSKEVPKVILYINEKTGFLSRVDSVLMLFLNKIGFDLFIYNPTGHNDIEQFLTNSIYDTHWLDDMIFDLEIKDNSIKKRFSGILKNLKGD